MIRHKYLLAAASLAATSTALVAQIPESAPCMMRGLGWSTDVIFTIGDDVGGFTPTGIPDGMSAFAGQNDRVDLFVQSELNPGNGYAYTLANGTQLTGARIHKYEISRVNKRGVVHSVAMAYDTIYDRSGNEVVLPDQVNETGNGDDGLARFCGGTGIAAGTYGFVEDIHICGEESSKPFHPHGGSVWVLDIDGEALWAAPSLGRGSWENLTPFETNDPQTVGLLMGDDRGGAALYMWIGTKNGVGDQSFLDRNGLKQGTLYYWQADNGDTTPAQFNTRGSVRAGTWAPIAVIDPAMAGQPGYDAQGYKDSDTQLSEVQALGSFQFSRPEDLCANPANGQQLVLNSTGRGSLFPEDNWGTVYIIDLDLTPGALAATLTIAADSDFEPVPDAGIRSPDNIDWASNGKIYINEDRSTGLFGAATGREASIWELDPVTFDIVRVGEMNRSVLLPVGSTDIGAGTIGHWESSGVIDVTGLFATEPGEVLLLSNVQAHGIRDGIIGDNPFLDEGGQLFFMSNVGVDHAISKDSALDFEITNGGANAPYAMVFAAINAGNAPNGWFYGIDVTFPELYAVSGPLFGMLDANGETSFSVPGGAVPPGFEVDVVTLQLNLIGAPVEASTAVTHRF